MTADSEPHRKPRLDAGRYGAQSGEPLMDLAPRDQRTQDALSRRFRHFAAFECRGYTSFYDHLSVAISNDRELLELASHAKQGQPIPNLFLAAAHRLVIADSSHDVARHYLSVSDGPTPDADPFPAFKAFCLDHREQMLELLGSKRVQTNEVGRCAYLLSAFGLIARHSGMPLALVDVGASAGLNLLFDRYHYNYSNGLEYGSTDSKVQLTAEVRGDFFPDLANGIPAVASRTGIDLTPVDLSDFETLMWMRSLVWPDHPERMARLNGAASIALADPPELVEGNALDLAPGILDTIPHAAAPCVLACHVLNQLTGEDRKRFWAIIEKASHAKAVYSVTAEAGQIAVNACYGGVWRAIGAAAADPHGWWVEWQNVDAARS